MKKILIDKEYWQTRVAILSENDKLQDIYYHSENKKELERSFFKSKISKILPGIQTAFVDIGQNRAGFLHITEIDRALAIEKTNDVFELDDDDDEKDYKKRTVVTDFNIGKIFKENEEVLVQVIKEPFADKGAKLTTCFTLPGKFIVLMPNIKQIGISRKIDDRNERLRLKEFVKTILPEGMGAIVRTTAEKRLEKDLKKDLIFLVDIWNIIQKKYKESAVGERLYEDLPLPLRVVRDHLYH